MISNNLLFKTEYNINDYIVIRIPTIEDIINHEDDYYSCLSIITSMPIDMMVQLDDIGIDFTKINEYELFLLMFGLLKSLDTSIMFKDLDLSKFEIKENKENDTIILFDEENGITIDRAIHDQMATFLRSLHNIEKNTKKPGNEEARKYMIDRARKKMRRDAKKKSSNSQLSSLIISLVNTEQFKYNFETVKKLTIYQFNESVKQVVKKISFDNRMIGVYSGSIDSKKLSQDDLNWLAK